MKIISKSGNPEVATIFVAVMRDEDKYSVEFVDGLDLKLPREEKWIINVSTQFGCPVKCVFCDAGGEYAGNLSSKEIIEQVKFVLNEHEELIDNCHKLKIHLARIGEPSMNDNVIDAIKEIRKLTDNKNLWCALPTIVPEDQDEFFEKLKQVKDENFLGRFQLQISMNSTSMEERKKMMPVKLKGFDWIAKYGEYFYEQGDRKIVLNFALAEDSEFDTEIIIKNFKPEFFAVKLTPLNPTSMTAKNKMETSIEEIKNPLEKKAELLAKAGFVVILSVGDFREDEIGSNCGQSVRRLGLRNSLQT